ncbi:ATP-dependent 6-phosphofructokinase [Botrimarina sp.]|uniref:6-phosphofructokinase n=1 Tax=Botrimarina sp. TaxID=2795802 RepID=UPI0032EB599C
MSTKRIGILTSGGDCPGLNAVIRGAVKACHQLGYDCVGFLKGYEGLYDPVQYVHLTPQSTRGILSQGGTILGSTNKGRFAATVGIQDRKELDPALVAGVKQTISQLAIDGLICVGGDGSLAVAQQLHESGVPVVGVPKTIDNDLSATAFTFGFDSAIECATDALDRLHTTAASHERIMVLEVMGRHAGWIALHAGIAGGGDVILIPEIEWNYEHVCHKILHRESQGKKFTLVVVAEGAELPGGGLVGEANDGAQMKLGGVGRAVAAEIERRLHRETRLSVLGHLQRGGQPTTFDRVLATQFGAHAVRLVKEGRFGEMICSQPPGMTSVPIIEAVHEIRRVDPHGPGVQAARALGISFGDRPADEIGQDIFDRLEPAAHLVHGHLQPTPAADEAPLLPAASESSQPTPGPGVAATVLSAQADEPLEEDEERLADEVLDLVAEADEAIHGDPLADLDDNPPQPAVDADQQGEPEAPAARSPVELPETPTVALELDNAEEEAADPDDSDDDDCGLPDLSFAQAELAERIAAAAKASRDSAPNSPALDESMKDLDAEELAAKPGPKASAKPAARGADKAAGKEPADDLDTEVDRLDDARSALEAALLD